MGITYKIKKLSTEWEVWTLAVRRKNGKTLYQGNGDSFTVIHNNARYWRADPFLWEYRGVTYLFAEMFDRKTEKGVIGVAKIKNGKCGRFKVCLDTPHHLSYPCVFERNGDIYMMPECAQSGKVTVYRSVRFPYEWKEAYVLTEGQYVDTTPIHSSEPEKDFYLTSRYDSVNCGNDNLCLMDENGTVSPIIADTRKSRCGGHIIHDINGFLRPVQDDTVSYGCGLRFNRITDADFNAYREETVLTVSFPHRLLSDKDVRITLTNPKKKMQYVGIHTYNASNQYEVIDLLIEKEMNPIVFWKNRSRFFQYLKQRAKSFGRR